MNSLRKIIRNNQIAVEQSAHVTKGHAAQHPGLRGHSVGALYPWTIVTYEKDGIKSFVAENLLTGTRLTATASYESAEYMLAYHLRRAEAAQLLAEHSAVTADTVRGLSLLGTTTCQSPVPKMQRQQPREVCALLTAFQSENGA